MVEQNIVEFNAVGTMFPEDKSYNEVRNFVESKHGATLKSGADLKRVGLTLIAQAMGGTPKEVLIRANGIGALTKSTATKLKDLM